MRIIDCLQGSDEWQAWRARPTASCFDRFITPAKGDYSAQATRYACEIVAKRMNLMTVESLPSLWCDFGNDFEDSAVQAYEKQFGVKTTKAGFVLSDHTDAFGCSPDRLINVTTDGKYSRCEGVLEVKCVKAETLMNMHLNDGAAELYAKPQVQGQLLITGASYASFFVFHPELEPFHLRILPDEEYQAKIANHLLRFLEEINRVESSIKRKRHEIIAVPAMKTELNWGD